MSILATTADYIYFLYGYSNASGDIPLQVARFNISNNTYTSLGSTVTHAFNDTNLIQFFNIETLTAVKKTTIQKSGEAFLPGQTNDFDDRVYWTMVASTNIDGDPVDTVYGYFDISNNALAITDTARTYGRQVSLVLNHFMQEGTGFLSGTNTRSNAGLPWRLRVGGRSASSAASSTQVAIAGHALDKTLDWSNGSGVDPGSNVYDTGGEIMIETGTIDGVSSEPEWNEKGIWRVANAANSTWINGATFGAGRKYGSTMSWSSTTGTSLNAVGANTFKVVLSTIDHSDGSWDDFLMSQVRGRLQNGQNVRMTIQTDNGNLSAVYVLTPQTCEITRNLYQSDYYIEISYFPGVNWQHSGDAWAFANSYDNDDTTKMAVFFTQI